MDPVVTGAVVKVGELTEKMAYSAANETGGVLVRLFGPMADVMGQHWADQLREKNLTRLMKKTEKRAKKEQDAGRDPGFANPRVASQVFESAQYSDSEVVAEYLSGVLASSRDASGKNDAGVAWSTVVSRLSSDQLRLHYVVYASARGVVQGMGLDHVNDAHNLEVVLPLGETIFANDLYPATRFADAVDGLMREGLIGDAYSYGPLESVFESERRSRPEFGADLDLDDGLRIRLSIHGLRLFLWGNGAGHMEAKAYLDMTVPLELADDDNPPTLVRAFAVKQIT